MKPSPHRPALISNRVPCSGTETPRCSRSRASSIPEVSSEPRHAACLVRPIAPVRLGCRIDAECSRRRGDQRRRRPQVSHDCQSRSPEPPTMRLWMGSAARLRCRHLTPRRRPRTLPIQALLRQGKGSSRRSRSKTASSWRLPAFVERRDPRPEAGASRTPRYRIRGRAH